MKTSVLSYTAAAILFLSVGFAAGRATSGTTVSPVRGLTNVTLVGADAPLSESDGKNTDNGNLPALVNINTADERELTSLDGIGFAVSASIIEYRTYNGLFKSIDELKNVTGIGSVMFEKIRNSITVGALTGN